MNRYYESIINPSTPSSYGNSLSYLEEVGQLRTEVSNLEKNLVNLGKVDNETLQEIKNIYEKIEDIKTSRDIPDRSIKIVKLHQEVIKFIQDISAETVTNVAKFLSFGLTDSGHFEVIIPDNWSEVSFDTNPDGNLILNF